MDGEFGPHWVDVVDVVDVGDGSGSFFVEGVTDFDVLDFDVVLVHLPAFCWVRFCFLWLIVHGCFLGFKFLSTYFWVSMCA